MSVRAAVLAALLLLPAAPASAQLRLADVLLGSPPPRGAPRLNLKALAKRKPGPLYVVIDTPYEIWSGMGSYVHVAVYRADFSPAKGARVYLGDRLVGTADQGTLVFKNVPRSEATEEDDSHTVRAVLEEGGKAFAGAVGFYALARTPSFEGAQLFVYADRGVYNPGQPVLIRLIAWRLKGEYQPLAREVVEVTLVDLAERVLGGQRVTTDEFGIGTLTIPLPEQMPEGSYELVVAYKGSKESTRLRVERYVPPAIEIVHDLKRYLTPQQRALAFGASVKSMAGGPLKAGTLSLRLSLKGKVLEAKELALDGRERYPLSFSPAAMDRLHAEAAEGDRFEVAIGASDVTGRSDEVVRDVTYLRNPYRAVLEADKDEYAAGEVALVNLKLVDVEDVPVRRKAVRVRVEPSGQRLDGRTDDSGVALFSIPTTAPQTKVLAFVDEVAAALDTATLTVLPDKAMVSKVAVPVVRERARVPIEVRIARGFVPTEAVLHGDVVDSSGALVSAFLLPITTEQGQAVARGSFTAPTWGTMLLTLFCAAAVEDAEARDRHGVGLLVEGQQISVQPDKALVVTLSGLPSSARPGEEVTFKAVVTKPGGARADAVLGASVVDAGVLAKLDPLETTPADRFYDPELKVLSTTGAKILTWPVVSRNWGSNRMDIALPPFEFDPPDAKGTDDAADPELAELTATLESGGIGAAGGFGGLGMKGFGAGGGGYGSGVASMESKPRIVVRESFPETALWAPRIPTRNGEATLKVKLPDGITRQAFTAVASDRAGGVGFVRHDLQIRQELYARSDFPAALVHGDEVVVRASVQNLGTQARPATLALASTGLEIVGEREQTVTVPADGAVGVEFRVRAAALGRHRYQLTASTAGLKDVERRELVVVPRGPWSSTERRAALSKASPFSATVPVAAGAPVEATLSIAFPGTVGLLAAFLDRVPDPNMFWEAPGSRATAAFHLRRALDRQGLLTPSRREVLDAALAADFVFLGALTTQTGAVIYPRTGKPSVYLTAKALEGFTALRAADFPVPAAQLQALTGALLGQLADGRFPTDEIVFWEGHQERRQQAFTAEIYRALCEAGTEAVVPRQRPALASLNPAMRALAETSDDPLAVANAALGLRSCEKPEGAWMSRVALRLLALRRGAYWEPSWFHAWGGTLEATALAMEVLGATPDAHPEAVRDCARFLLGAQEGFGHWRNPSGTAAIVRALANLPRAPLGEVASTVRIEVNGKPVAATAIDPRDPAGSALGLARFELTPHLAQGSNAVTVRYDGALEPAVTLQERRIAPAAGALVRATRAVSKSALAAGEVVEVKLSLAPKSPLGRVAVEQRLPSNASVDEAALGSQVQSGRIADYRLSRDTLVLYLDRLDVPIELAIPLLGTRAGKCEVAPAFVRPLLEPEKAEAAGEPLALEVR